MTHFSVHQAALKKGLGLQPKVEEKLHMFAAQSGTLFVAETGALQCATVKPWENEKIDALFHAQSCFEKAALAAGKSCTKMTHFCSMKWNTLCCWNRSFSVHEKVRKMVHFSTHQASLKKDLWLLATIAEKWCIFAAQSGKLFVAETWALQCTALKPSESEENDTFFCAPSCFEKGTLAAGKYHGKMTHFCSTNWHTFLLSVGANFLHKVLTLQSTFDSCVAADDTPCIDSSLFKWCTPRHHHCCCLSLTTLIIKPRKRATQQHFSLHQCSPVLPSGAFSCQHQLFARTNQQRSSERSNNTLCQGRHSMWVSTKLLWTPWKPALWLLANAAEKHSISQAQSDAPFVAEKGALQCTAVKQQESEKKGTFSTHQAALKRALWLLATVAEKWHIFAEQSATFLWLKLELCSVQQWSNEKVWKCISSSHECNVG